MSVGTLDKSLPELVHHLLQISLCPEAGWNVAVKFSWWQRVEGTTNQEVVRCERHLVFGKISDNSERS